MKKQQTKTQSPLTEEEQKRDAIHLIFEQLTQQAGEFLKPFDTDKYRCIVVVDHQALGTKETLIAELICYHFNITFGKNKNGFHQIYFNYDEEAITKFSTRVYNQMVRLLCTLSTKEVTAIDIEDRVRFSAKPTDVKNFFYKRLIDGTKEHITLTTMEKATV